MTFRIDIFPQQPKNDQELLEAAALAGCPETSTLHASRYYLVQGALDEGQAEQLANELLCDPITETSKVNADPGSDLRVIEAQKQAGVMDPVEASVIKGAAQCGIELDAVRIGRRIEVADYDDAACELFAWKVLANQAIESVAIDPSEGIRFPNPGGSQVHERTEVSIRDSSDEELLKLSREGCLSLNLAEMQTIQKHFNELGREPTDVELESIAQTWSEHCVHKTLKGFIDYQGPDGRREIDNLLKCTIAKATTELDKEWCISVFTDNSGIINFDDEFGVCLKVETHNHPSAIEPYGGANTGMGGVIRDILGTGLGAQPICNTDVFCFGHLDSKTEDLPPGTIHPRRLMAGVVSGVRDYGNRMGIPTVNGCIRFDDRYVGNPLVFCGTAGLIPRDKCFGDANVGDHILVIGGRTGRDGIHGATFSSIELTEDSETVSSGAVQIGNAIQEKKVADTFLQARDKGYFSATTDCGAGGVSSAIGEMGEALGCEVFLDRMPLKYDGLSYTEIWISEAQERMVAAVPPEHVEAALALFAAEDVEATDVGTITGDKKLHLHYHGTQVAELGMDFLHDGLPRIRRHAEFKAPVESAIDLPAVDIATALPAVLARPNVASKEWVIRQYDHEVQAGSIVKPLVGVNNDGPSDAAVVAPRLGHDRGVAIASGLNTCYGDVDAYHAAAAGIEESLRNLVCVGAPLDEVAILDNFSWGNCDKPENLGALVRACEACYDLAMHYGTPFISGKDSLNNEYSHGGETIVIPHTLLITAMTVVPDVRQCITMDVKAAGDLVYVVGSSSAEMGGSELLGHLELAGGFVPKLDKERSSAVLNGVAAATAAGLVNAAHDCSDGGLAVTLAEMAFAGGLGMDIDLMDAPVEGVLSDVELLFSESLSRLVVTVPADQQAEFESKLGAAPFACIGKVSSGNDLEITGAQGSYSWAIEDLRQAWKGGLGLD